MVKRSMKIGYLFRGNKKMDAVSTSGFRSRRFQTRARAYVRKSVTYARFGFLKRAHSS